MVIGIVENQDPIFAITDTNFYVLVATLSTQGRVKLLKQLESGFKVKINWNKYQSKVTQQTRNKNLDFLIDPSFQGVNRDFRYLNIHLKIGIFDKVKKDIFLRTVEITHYNVMIDGRNFFNQPVKVDLRTNDNIRQTAISQHDDSTTGF